jgi:glycosyltransferase involved in cell wall biosynthesis
VDFRPDLIVAYDALSPAALRGARMARKLGSTLILVEAGLDGQGRWSERVLRSVGDTLWGRYVRKTAGAVVALDPLAREQALRQGFGSALVSIVPYGVDVQAFRPGLSSTLVARQKIRGRILVYVGRLARGRGLEELTAAFARTIGQRSDWNLVFGGDGPLQPELRAMAERLGVGDRIHCVRPREEELPGLLGASTVFAVPAKDDHVVGRHVGRAMACGLPILASDLPRLRGFVEPERNGLLVPACSIEAWAEAIQRMACSPTTRSRWAQTSRRIAEEKLSWPAVATRFEEVFGEARARVRLKLGERPAISSA